MEKDQLIGLVATVLVSLFGVAFAYAGSDGAPLSAGLHPFALAVVLAIAIQWLAFIPAFVKQTEMFFDLIGSLTFITVTIVAYFYSGNFDVYATIALLLVITWAGRLGSFLFQRIKKAGKDGRFDEVKTSGLRFLMAWSLQGFWVTFTAAAALVAITATQRPEFGALAVTGLVVWAIGFAIEVIADRQKRQFTSDPENEGEFIDVGLWSVSRHPNYFGEIIIWTGVAIFAIPALQGLQYWMLISPVLVAIQLICVSGIPPLENRADKKWGGQADYERYKRETPVLIPRPW